MRYTLILIFIVGIVVGTLIAMASVTDLEPITEESSAPMNNDNVLCHQKTKNICVDYMGEHSDFCVSETANRHWWCHENYCINKEFSCIGSGTNKCEASKGACVFS